MSMLSEIASIEGFDEETAGEIQTRASEYLAAIEQAEHDDERKALGVEDELYEIAGPQRRDAGGARQGRHQDASRISPAMPPTIWSAGPNARTARREALRRRLQGLRRVAARKPRR